VVAAVRIMASEASISRGSRGRKCSRQMRSTIRAGRIFDLELVGAPGNGADVSEQLVFQYFPRFTAPRLEGAAAV
jgi:hypothetical protein